ncbi:MATE family efflux transporter [Agrobacterium vitis]|uniref:MATE family efflux transporter n=1 Tax=Rhizobium/Agrobacterium group TaxID=227290 RepID=UPI0012E975CF|nr:MULTISPECIES: MATE family efflux transporter [Rhizobium/Agrobacterium group]MCF1492433.1 MATE family efflux transporter [Allorhizobium ampelinum]MVA47489.1 MATE family efflux transporter [Agrobacterium vitis]
MTYASSQRLGAPIESWLSHVRATLALGIPLAGAQLAQLAIHTTDVVIVGRLGAESLAALVLAGQFFFTVFIFGSGFSIAVMPMVANAYGKGDVRLARRSIRMGLWVSLAYSVVTWPLFHYSRDVLLALGQVPQVVELASSYIRIMWLSLPVALMFAVMRALVSAIGRAQIVLYITIATLVLNAALAYCIVLGHFGFPAFGILGAAWVAVSVNVFAMITMGLYLHFNSVTRKYELFVRFWRPDWDALRDVIKLGLPIGVTVLAEVSLFTAASLLMGSIGTIELAAHGIALQLASIAFMIPLGLAQAATVRIGVAHGRDDFTDVVRASITVVCMAALISVIGGLLFFFFSNELSGMFLDRGRGDAAAVLDYAAPLVVVAGIFQLVDGMQAVATGLLRGLKDASVPMVLALISYWPIGFGLAWFMAFPLGMGGLGVWFGFLIGLSSAAVMMGLRFWLRLRHEMRMMSR